MCVSVRNTAILMLLSSFSFAGPGFESSLIKMVVADLGGWSIHVLFLLN
jgi:hypothetical protein